MRYQGKITSWKDDKGFGFITRNDGGKPVFVHIKSFANRQRRPVEMDIVTYEVVVDAKGREQAARVAFVGERVASPQSVSPERSHTSLILIPVLVIFLVWGVITGKLPPPLFGMYFIASPIAFLLYAFDKSAALNKRWRTSENTLHFCALLGGWPGALIAQKMMRHKSSKQSFQTAFWMTVVLNCAGLGGYLFVGHDFVRSVLATV